VATVDTAGNYNMTVPHIASFRDTVPPSPPTGLVGAIDTTGVVTISWESNIEPDMMGYNVYFANKDNHIYTNLSPKPRRDTFFIDTLQLNTTTEEIFYKVVAVDFNYHVSEFSIPLRLEKPDVIPPLPPRFKSYHQEEGKIILEMITSKAKDAETQILYRRSNIDTSYAVIGAIREGVMIDSSVVAGVEYAYKAHVIDDDGLEAFTEVFITAKDTKRPDTPEALQVIYDSGSKSAKLTWTADRTVSNYIIYRSKDNGPFMKLMTVSDPHHTDRRMLIPSHQYSYKIKSENRKGIRSDFTQPMTIVITSENTNNE